MLVRISGISYSTWWFGGILFVFVVLVPWSVNTRNGFGDLSAISGIECAKVRPAMVVYRVAGE